MIRVIQGSAALAMLAAAFLAGCQQAPPTQPVAGPIFAPFTAVTVATPTPAQRAAGVAVRPNPAAQDQFVMDQLATAYGRSEPSVLSSQPIYRISAYSEYTVDAQPIGPALGGPGGGYRYRYVSRGAVSFP